MLNIKVDQLAFIAHSLDDEIMIKKTLGLDDADWVEDLVLAEGYVRQGNFAGIGENVARLQFNYDYGQEIEILRYLSGPNYAAGLEGGNLCHIGAHAREPYTAEGIKISNFPVVQQVITQKHTNPGVLDAGRRYRYTIYNTTDLLGTHFKVIERLTESEAPRLLTELKEAYTK